MIPVPQHTALALLLAAGSLLPAAAAPDTLKGKVVSVADGDTITIRLKDGSTEKVRLFGIDAPEKDQPYGNEAKRKLNDLVYNKSVTVKTQDTDDYGRVVGTLVLNGKDINLAMVKAGCAWHYKHYAPDNTKLAEAEKSARAAKAGLWKAPQPTPPWDFRKDAREAENGSATPATRRSTPSGAAEPTPESGSITGTVERVVDGDTLHVRLENGRREKVQLFGIDAPEPAQEYGTQATQELEKLVMGKQVTVEYPGREDLGRLNGKVYVGKQYVNLILVQRGAAWHSDKYGPEEDDLRAAQQEAKAAGTGLWKDPQPTPPWKFRNGY